MNTLKDYVNFKLTHADKVASAEGYPLTMQNCKKYKKMKDLEIYGNSFQDGTPTPEAPIEVVSVGEKSYNLLNDTNFKSSTMVTGFNCDYEGDGVFHIYGEHNPSKANGSEGSPYFALDIPVEDVDSYYSTCAEVIEGTSGNINTYFFMGIKNETSELQFANAQIPAKSATGYKIQTPAKPSARVENATSFYRAWLYFTWGSSNPVEYLDYRIRVWFYKGYDSTSSYEPYGKYKIPVVQRGINLFNHHIDDEITPFYRIGFEKTFNDDNSFNLSATSLRQNYCYLGGQATIVANQECFIPKGEDVTTFGTWDCIDDTACIGVCFYGNDKVLVRQFNTLQSGAVGKWITTKDIYYISYVIRLPNQVVGNALDINNIKIQVELGDTATPYEPYVEPVTTNIFLDEPLRKLGDYADYIDFKENKVVRNIREWATKDNLNTAALYKYWKFNAYRIILNDFITLKTYEYAPIASNMFANGGYCAENIKTSIGYSEGNYIYFRFDDENNYGVSDTTTFKEFVSLYNPIIYYPRAEPTEEPIICDLPKLTAKTTIIEVDTSLAPSNIYGKYIKK